MLTKNDLKQIKFFKNGFPYLRLYAPATAERGIKLLSEKEQVAAIDLFENFDGKVCKFVPASGAATRMFNDLYDALTQLEKGEIPDKNLSAVKFLDNIKRYAFYEDLCKTDGFDINDRYTTLRNTLLPSGLNYGLLPKGMIKFHKYTDGSRTSFEEHLVEAALYTKGKNNISKMVVTVSPEHVSGFDSLLEKVKEKYEKRYKVTFDVSFTLQKPSTNTIAVDENNVPFRKSDGNILYRPGGHGALIENLNDLTSEIVVIKNIDNVVKDDLISEAVRWKKILGGILIGTREKLFQYIEALDGENNPLLIDEIVEFLDKEFCIKLPSVPYSILKEYIRAKLNRPIRVCGMVENQGEPGGGPYIVYDADGSTSLQILESAQLDVNSPETLQAISKSTHFNPVDLVCSFIDYKGEKFDLNRFVDPETGFISHKSLEGRLLKAQELPGLWNGAMSQWNTVFVEVPVITFNPVKTVLDLLRPEHLV